jgi:hypothetical protein
MSVTGQMEGAQVLHYLATSALRPASVIRTRAISIVRLPATTRSAVARREPGTHQLDHLLDREAMRDHDRLGAAVAAGDE